MNWLFPYTVKVRHARDKKWKTMYSLPDLADAMLTADHISKRFPPGCIKVTRIFGLVTVALL